MFDVDQFRQLAKQLKAAVGSFDPDVVHGRDAAVLVQLFSELERLGAAAKVLAARRVEATNAMLAVATAMLPRFLLRRPARVGARH